MTTRIREKVEQGSSNIFKDAEALRPALTLDRAQVMSRIAGILKERGMTQKKSGKNFGYPADKGFLPRERKAQPVFPGALV